MTNDYVPIVEKKNLFLPESSIILRRIQEVLLMALRELNTLGLLLHSIT